MFTWADVTFFNKNNKYNNTALKDNEIGLQENITVLQTGIEHLFFFPDPFRKFKWRILNIFVGYIMLHILRLGFNLLKKK